MCPTRLRQDVSRGGKALTAGLSLAGELGGGADEHMPNIIVHGRRHGAADTPKMLQFSLAGRRLRSIIQPCARTDASRHRRCCLSAALKCAERCLQLQLFGKRKDKRGPKGGYIRGEQPAGTHHHQHTRFETHGTDQTHTCSPHPGTAHNGLRELSNGHSYHAGCPL